MATTKQKLVGLLGLVVCLCGMACVCLAADQTWDGSTDMNWTEPDGTSWGAGTYQSGDNVTFNATGAGTVDLQAGTVTPSNITINSNSSYTFTNGTITATGTLTQQGDGGSAFLNISNLTVGVVDCQGSTGYTPGAIQVSTLSDSADPIKLNGGSFCLSSAATADLVLNQRPIIITDGTGAGTVYLGDNSDSYGIKHSGEIQYDGTGNRTLVLLGSGGGESTIIGNITNSPGGTTGITKSGGTWGLSGTNTYSGNTTVSGGWLTFHGLEAVSSGTKLGLIADLRSGLAISLLMDDAGTVNLGNELEMTGSGAYEYSTAVFSVNVNNDGGSTSNSTLALGKMDFTNTGGNQDTARLLRSTGANGYRLQFGDVDLNWFFNGTMGGRYTGPQGFYSDTAPITITGTVKQINGTTAADDVANGFFLGGTGTTTTNYVTGHIKDADDYDDSSNTNAKALFVNLGGNSSENVPVSDAIWELASSNSYSGGTFIRYGTLIGNYTNALGDGDVDVVLTSGDLIIGADGAMNAGATLTLPDASTETLTMNADCKIARLYLGGVQQLNGAYDNSKAWLGGPGTLTVGSLLYYWDINGGTPGAGGATPSGTWNDVNTYWNSVSDGSGAVSTWPAGETPIFSAGSDATGEYTVTVDGTKDISGLSFEDGDVTLSGGTALRLTADAIFYVSSAGQTATVATAVSEDATARDLTKGGDGTLVLSASNTYSGAFEVYEGRLLATAPGSVRGSSIAIDSGATLEVTGDGAVNGGTVTINSGGTLEISHSNAVAWATGITKSNGSLIRNTDARLGNLTIDDSNYTFTDKALVFNSGSTINTRATTSGTIRFSCGVSGSPDVRVRINTYGQRYLYFDSGAGTNNALGAVVNPYDSSAGSAGHLHLAGTSTSTVESIGWESVTDGHLYKEGTSKWTVNGDVDQETVTLSAGTLIINGALKNRAAGLQTVPSGARLGGDLTITQPGATAMSSITVNGGGILSPGDGGVGTLTVDWGAGAAARELLLSDSSIYEWDLADGSNDMIDVNGDIGDGQTETLNLDNFVLKVTDLGADIRGDWVNVFTYNDSEVTVDMSGFGNTAANFDVSSLDSTWWTNGLSLVDDGTGAIYVANLSKAYITNAAVSDVGRTFATFNGTLRCARAGYDVYVHWGEADGTNSYGSWTNTLLIGSWTNVGSTNVTYDATGLAASTTHYYTFSASNATETLWASPSVEFMTIDVPEINNSTGATSEVETSATLRGELVSGGLADVWICWGDNEGGTDSTSDWDNVVSMGSVEQDAPFSTLVTGLTSNKTYWYRCYAYNSLGSDWSDAATSFNGTPVTSGGGAGSGGDIVEAGLSLNFDASNPTSGVSGGSWVSLTADASQDMVFNADVTLENVTSGATIITNAYRFTGGAADTSLANWDGKYGEGVATTWELWIKPDDTGAAAQTLTERGGSGDGHGIWYEPGTLSDGSGTVNFTIDAGTPYQTVSAVIDTTEFRHITCVWDVDYSGSVDLMQIYVDGVMIDDNISSTTNDAAGNDNNDTGLDAFCGGDSGGVGNYYNSLAEGSLGGPYEGDIAVFRVWGGVALTADQVETNYNAMLISGSPIANLAPTDITNNAASMNAGLVADADSYNVYVHWGTTDGGTNAGAWEFSYQAGTNLNTTNVSYTVTGLQGNTTNWYTFRASNATTEAWAEPSWMFMTLPSPAPAGSIFMLW